jgi:hypothetical protein
MRGLFGDAYGFVMIWACVTVIGALVVAASAGVRR